jgi:hypothetical protein
MSPSHDPLAAFLVVWSLGVWGVLVVMICAARIARTHQRMLERSEQHVQHCLEHLERVANTPGPCPLTGPLLVALEAALAHYHHASQIHGAMARGERRLARRLIDEGV